MKFRSKALLCAMAAAALPAATPATAQMVTPKDPQAISSAIKEKGWPAKLVLPDDDNPYIESSYNDMKFLVLLMNCDDEHQNCTTLQYYMGFSDAKDTTLDELNEWNRTKRFARAYRDNEGDPVLEMDVDLDFGGIPRANLLETFNTWSALMDAYHSYLFD
ncbi:YbjN domain-containing protein [Erythrobacter mangrovi]|uniref:YbjN domain-containing protein n=1 Tax=Erythrobacter mangrovi TaxID=2739433 RepID=A0A7D3XHW2_9SPHN|nr:YbjN domain-containing protein [Erythrobacter mangrovi]QKG71673.1 YbjN domain-containing protein [Erythrobacter mangrovi]